jgi:hypothetical protein
MNVTAREMPRQKDKKTELATKDCMYKNDQEGTLWSAEAPDCRRVEFLFTPLKKAQ